MIYEHFLTMPRVSGITLIFLVVFLTKQSSPSPMTGWKELEEALSSAEKVLLPEVERNKTEDEGPDYFYDKEEVVSEIPDKDHLDYNLQHHEKNVCKIQFAFSYVSKYLDFQIQNM